MGGHLKALVAFGLFTTAFGSVATPSPSVMVTRTTDIAVRRDVPDVHVAAVIPTDAGQIGINPPDPNAIKGSIGINTEYLTDLGETTSWIGQDPSYITVATTTFTDKAGSTSVATITKGVSAHKNEAGGIDILLSPAVKVKLEEIAKNVRPCGVKRVRRRRLLGKRQGGPSCGLADFVQQVGEDSELQDIFTQQLTDQVWGEVDSGYGSDDAADLPDWEGDGAPETVDEGYFSDGNDGWYEGAEAGEEGLATEETVVFGSEAEAAVLSDLAAGAGEGEIYGAATLTAGSFLAFIWGIVAGGGKLEPVYVVPQESVHKITKTKTTTTTQPASCPTPNNEGWPSCASDCVPTSVEVAGARVTRQVEWFCSEGDSKDCMCMPLVDDIAHEFNEEAQKAIWAALDELENAPNDPVIECPGPLSSVPSEFLGDIAVKFCENAMKRTEGTIYPRPYDIYGNPVSLLKRSGRLSARSPPEDRDDYKDYRFFLNYIPKEGSCTLPQKKTFCEDAFIALVKDECGANHGSAGDRLSVDAVIDVGCAEFSWHIEKFEPQPVAGEQHCNGENTGKDTAVQQGQLDTWASLGCHSKAAGPIFKPGMDKVMWTGGAWKISGAEDLSFMKYQIQWVDGCTRFDEQDGFYPDDTDDSLDCVKLMHNNWEHCKYTRTFIGTGH